MSQMLTPFFHAIYQIPDLFWLSPVMIIYIGLCAAVTAIIKKRFNWPTGYTRKLFHFTIFTAAAVIQYQLKLPGTLLFGSLVSLYVIISCIRGNRSKFYQAIARPRDAPHQTFFIIVPMICTALGGIFSNILFNEYAIFGYLVAGWGDAIAEPVGTKWGRHVYRVPSIYGVKSSRTIEGSVSVLIVGILACVIHGTILHLHPLKIIISAIGCGLAGTLVEAVSNHGLDNLTVQLAVSGMAFMLLI